MSKILDPPYNTGNKDFVYDDSFVEKVDAFSHSKWLSFVQKRLEIARRLLRDDGAIFISIDESESAQLKILCDEIFGEDNFQTTIHIQVRYPHKSLTEDKHFKPVIEYVYVYAKNSALFDPNKRSELYTEEKFVYRITELSEGEKIYVRNQEVTVYKKGEWKIEELPEGSLQGLKETWISGTIYTKMSYGKVFQSIVEPRVKIDGLSSLYKVHGRGEDGLGYRYYTGPQRANAKRGKMYSGIPLDRLAQIESGESLRYRPIDTFYDMSAEFGNISHEGRVTFNSGKKPVGMVSALIRMSKRNNCTVLDFFAGSGTTGHAVAQLNKEDGGNRKYILCTNNENNICEEVTYQRLKNIQEDLPHNLKYFKTDFTPKFSDEEDILSDRLLSHIKELVELENMCEIDGVKHILVLTEEDIETLEQSDIQAKAKVYVPSFILLSRELENKFKKKDVEVIAIPDYYFLEELREVGEL